jgi:hypothetical protein
VLFGCLQGFNIDSYDIAYPCQDFFQPEFPWQRVEANPDRCIREVLFFRVEMIHLESEV